MAEITYRDGTEPLVVTFEEIADLHDIVEDPFGPDWNLIEQIVVTLNLSSVDPHREEIGGEP
jgi:hypothetical protein